MGYLLKLFALLSLVTHSFLRVCGGPEGISLVATTSEARPDSGSAKRYHERAKYYFKGHALGSALDVHVHDYSWLQSQKGRDVEGEEEKKKEEEGEGAKKHDKHKEKESEESNPSNPASFFPELFQKVFDLSKKATKHLDKCLQLMDDIKGDIDSIPHDEKTMPILSDHVKIEVGSQDLSVHMIVKHMREAVEKLYHLQGYLSSGKTQINAKLRKLLPSPAGD